MSDDLRRYPDRPILAVSAAIVRDGRLLLVERGRGPALGRFTVPGGVVEGGETLTEALLREVLEETGLTIEPVALAGHREVIVRDGDGRFERHFVILCFACRWLTGEVVLNDELASAQWIEPAELGRFNTTDGLAEIVDAAYARLAETA